MLFLQLDLFVLLQELLKLLQGFKLLLWHHPRGLSSHRREDFVGLVRLERALQGGQPTLLRDDFAGDLEEIEEAVEVGQRD